MARQWYRMTVVFAPDERFDENPDQWFPNHSTADFYNDLGMALRELLGGPSAVVFEIAGVDPVE